MFLLQIMEIPLQFHFFLFELRRKRCRSSAGSSEKKTAADTPAILASRTACRNPALALCSMPNRHPQNHPADTRRFYLFGDMTRYQASIPCECVTVTVQPCSRFRRGCVCGLWGCACNGCRGENTRLPVRAVAVDLVLDEGGECSLKEFHCVSV